MPKIQFSDLTVKTLKPGVYFDTKTTAFGIRVGKNKRTWFVLKGANSVKVGVGRYPSLSLADARKRALVALGVKSLPIPTPFRVQ
jgi:Arm DNA-binding domain